LDELAIHRLLALVHQRVGRCKHNAQGPRAAVAWDALDEIQRVLLHAFEIADEITSDVTHLSGQFHEPPSV